MSPGKGYQWLEPKTPIEKGDEALFWATGELGPAWTPCLNSIGKRPTDTGMFIRRKIPTPEQTRSARNNKPVDPSKLP